MGAPTTQRPGLPARAAHLTIAWAMILAARDEGTTVTEVERSAGVSNRNAARWLERLCKAGFLHRSRVYSSDPHPKAFLYTIDLSCRPAYLGPSKSNRAERRTT